MAVEMTIMAVEMTIMAIEMTIMAIEMAIMAIVTQSRGLGEEFFNLKFPGVQRSAK
jgi:hypothetical protein